MKGKKEMRKVTRKRVKYVKRVVRQKKEHGPVDGEREILMVLYLE